MESLSVCIIPLGTSLPVAGSISPDLVVVVVVDERLQHPIMTHWLRRTDWFIISYAQPGTGDKSKPIIRRTVNEICTARVGQMRVSCRQLIPRRKELEFICQ